MSVFGVAEGASLWNSNRWLYVVEGVVVVVVVVGRGGCSGRGIGQVASSSPLDFHLSFSRLRLRSTGKRGEGMCLYGGTFIADTEAGSKE